VSGVQRMLSRTQEQRQSSLSFGDMAKA
jgi:hypothetical protein